MKTRDIDVGVIGLSSGASSALTRDTEGSVVRIKRCGFGERGFKKIKKTSDMDQVPGWNSNVFGLQSTAEALHECGMLLEFNRQGLCNSCIPISVDLLADEGKLSDFDGSYAVIRIKIDSDLRADEWFLGLLKEGLRRQGLPETLTVLRSESISVNLSNEDFIEWRNGPIPDHIHDLGVVVGGSLRRVHDAGFYRGRGSVWMGNEVVGPDLWLSSVDCDGGAGPLDSRFSEQKRIEFAEYAAGFADCFSWGQPNWVAEAATTAVEGFREGYKLAAQPRLKFPLPFRSQPAPRGEL